MHQLLHVDSLCICLSTHALACVVQGALRDALDRKRLPRVASGTTFLQPDIALSLSHDIAAAMLHLHSEGIV